MDESAPLHRETWFSHIKNTLKGLLTVGQNGQSATVSPYGMFRTKHRASKPSGLRDVCYEQSDIPAKNQYN